MDYLRSVLIISHSYLYKIWETEIHRKFFDEFIEYLIHGRLIYSCINTENISIKGIFTIINLSL